MLGRGGCSVKVESVESVENVENHRLVQGVVTEHGLELPHFFHISPPISHCNTDVNPLLAM